MRLEFCFGRLVLSFRASGTTTTTATAAAALVALRLVLISVALWLIWRFGHVLTHVAECGFRLRQLLAETVGKKLRKPLESVDSSSSAGQGAELAPTHKRRQDGMNLPPSRPRIKAVVEMTVNP